ncbi:MAG TPA: patatin-like phospholipase family protein [Bacteroidales bacterium]|nr:patatin-like phospholipase family protein [Bacteroidales bacterium]HPS73639.1 patatin-like phospholipase family protein [Bacteroidales bacterium]
MRTGQKIAIVFLSLLLLASSAIRAQKVALVLSGGGSKGAAHIGVIRALEEQNIPIDYVIGTSIGAVIAAMYSCGYSPDEMETLISSRDFNNWANGITDRQYVMYYRKEAPNASWLSFDLHAGKKLTSILPTNLVPSYLIDFELMHLFANASAASVRCFDSLMIPFRCVVTNIDSSKQIILRKGDLGSAVRGSMSIPFVFTPMMIDGELVFDGGMYNNFPADVARNEFHPDVIIGSRVAERFEKAQADDVFSQFLTMMMNRQADTLTGKDVAMIVPNIPPVSLLDFSRTSELGDSGYVACMKEIPDIQQLVKRRVSPADMATKRMHFRMKENPVFFDSISITGLNKTQSEYIHNYFFGKERLLSISEVKKRFLLLIDGGFFKRIYPQAVYNPSTNGYTLLLDVQKNDPFNLQFGGNLSLGTSNEGFLEMKYRYLWKTPVQVITNGYFGKFYNSARIGVHFDFNNRLPFYTELFYTFGRYDYFKNTTYFFDDPTPSYLIQTENYSELNTGIPAGPRSKASLGILYSSTVSRYYQSNTFSRTDTADQTTFDFFSPRLCFELNTLNAKQYPSSGIRLKIHLSYINGREYTQPGSHSPDVTTYRGYHDWYQLNILYDNYFRSFGPFRPGIYAEGVISSQPFFSNRTSSLAYAPAFQPIPEMQTLFIPAYRATDFMAFGARLITKIYKKIEFRTEAYVFMPYQEIITDEVTGKQRYGEPFSYRSYAVSGTFVYRSFVGPISLGVNFYDKLSNPVTLSLNFGYIIFNERSFR